MLDPVLTEIKKLKSVRKQAHTGAFTREKILEKTRKYLVRVLATPRRAAHLAPGVLCKAMRRPQGTTRTHARRGYDRAHLRCLLCIAQV